jgi:phage terminase large subunit GpA-like protein
VPNAVPGSVSLFGKLPHAHKTFADEICAEILDEYIEETDGGNVFYKWTNKVGVRNDKLDSTTMAFAGLSYMGASENKLSQVRVHKQPKNRRRGRKVTKIKV